MLFTLAQNVTIYQQKQVITILCQPKDIQLHILFQINLQRDILDFSLLKFYIMEKQVHYQTQSPAMTSINQSFKLVYIITVFNVLRVEK